MEGVGEPDLLVRGADAAYLFKGPSEASMLEGRRRVFWVGPPMEIFLADALDTLAAGADNWSNWRARRARAGVCEGGSFKRMLSKYDVVAHDDHGHDHDAHGDEEAHGQDDFIGHDRDDDGHPGHEERRAPGRSCPRHAHAATTCILARPKNAEDLSSARSSSAVEAVETNAETYGAKCGCAGQISMGSSLKHSEAVAKAFPTAGACRPSTTPINITRAAWRDRTGSITVNPEVAGRGPIDSSHAGAVWT